MKSKLKIFNDFAEGILPHEASYLLKDHKIRDDEKESILDKVCSNATSLLVSYDFDETIDKRKYTYIKKWIAKKLQTKDVDGHLNYLSAIENKILTDTIKPSEEKDLLNEITSYTHTSFYFQKFYELVREYQDFLLIRFRYKDCKLTESFLKENRNYYLKAVEVKEQLFFATKDLTRQYTSGSHDTKHWEEQLLEFMRSENLDGLNRYNAFIRLVFLYFNYKEYEKATSIFDQVDKYFQEGLMYSRRILFNYYANRVILHSNLEDLEKAEYYAYLSIKQENSDKLFYLNNLIAILLKKDKNKEALELMVENYDLYKKTHNHHHKLGFATHYIRTLVRNKRLNVAENFANNFLNDNNEDVFEHRWRHFFSSYLMLLITKEKYSEVLKIIKKYNLIERETEVMHLEDFIPKIHWYHTLSNYMVGNFSEEKLKKEFILTAESAENFSKKGRLDFSAFVERLSFTFPGLFSSIKSHLVSEQ
ncbi:hypothetical protein LB452_08445 [Psychroflexus sp. CAK8W]|uniref:Tetratricopeptide repeat-containing protein n=1 Tax=Psychroflexus longus TaxID=2873596 RepID=A0ABS7XIZ9_9FLAO|nr:hypothetical protein [Psychroflexus longus]MBZ9778950.1 hypothetical protein [Psychroflexus longus]